ncbi:hypothetical protein SDC9_189978 [bioreactor metagenome]|uniref:Uncharacterized protein n=1 Tax=bioreactor metagenome TaxID=1076179 RepID=A0A645HTQ1_9ZZZZ
MVSVPVLSVQITVVDPSVSTEAKLRTSAFTLAILCTPRANVMVATKGKPSGTAATARAMPVSSILIKSLPCIMPIPITRKATPKVTQIRN